MRNGFHLKEFAIALCNLTIAATLVLLFLAAGGWCWLADSGASYFGNTKALLGRDFRPVGRVDGGIEGSAAVIRELQEGQAVLEAQGGFKAEDFPLMRLDVDPVRPGISVVFFWWLEGEPGDVRSKEVYPLSEHSGYYPLFLDKSWRGTVEAVAIGFFGESLDETIRLHSVQLKPYGFGDFPKILASEWLRFVPWKHSSINNYRTTDYTITSPTFIISLILVVSVVLNWLFQRHRSSGKKPGPTWAWHAFATQTVIAWILLTVLWSNRSLHQVQTTLDQFGGLSPSERRAADWDKEYYEFSELLRAEFPDKAGRLALLYVNKGMKEPYPQRLRYHLLPEVQVAQIVRANRKSIRTSIKEYDWVLLLGSEELTRRFLEKLDSESQLAGIGSPKVVLDHKLGKLIRINDDCPIAFRDSRIAFAPNKAREQQ